MFRKAKFVALLALVAVILTTGGSFRYVVGWALLGYVLYRAFPGIRADLSRAWSLASSFKPRRGARSNVTL